MTRFAIVTPVFATPGVLIA